MGVMILFKVVTDGFIDVNGWLSYDSTAELILLYSQQNVVEKHLVYHFKYVISYVFLVEFQESEIFCQPLELIIRNLNDFLCPLIFLIIAY